MEKNIFISSNKEYSSLLLEKVIHVRKKYSDNIIVIENDVLESVKTNLKENYKVEFIDEIKSRGEKQLVMDRIIQVANILKYRRRSVNLILDNYSWTIDDPNCILDTLHPEYNKIVFTVSNSIEPGKLEDHHTKFESEEFKSNIKLLIDKYQGVINSSALFATREGALDLAIFFKKMIRNNITSGEKLMNYYYDEAVHSILDKKRST